MHLDDLNNSQLVLLCLLITLIVSVAISVATLAFLTGRLGFEGSERTVINQTVNRVIERTIESRGDDIDLESIISSSIDELKKSNLISIDTPVTVNQYKESIVSINEGGFFLGRGIYINREGDIYSFRIPRDSRIYSVTNGERTTQYKLKSENSNIITPIINEGEPKLVLDTFFPIINKNKLTIGTEVSLITIRDEDLDFYKSYISNLSRDREGNLSKLKLNIGGFLGEYAIFMDRAFVGILNNSTGWIDIINTN